MDQSNQRRRAQRAGHRSRDGRDASKDAVADACVGHLYTIIGRMEFVATNAALVLLTVISLAATLNRKSMTDWDTASMFIGAALGEGERERGEAGNTIALSHTYFRMVTATLTPAMFAMLGSILFVVALPTEAAFFDVHKPSTNAKVARALRTPYIRLIDAIHPLPEHVRAACGLEEERRLFTVLSTLYYAIHFALFLSVVMAIAVTGSHLSNFVAPLPRTGRDCLGTWASSAGVVSATYREGWAWRGTPPYFNATAYPGILSEDQLAEHTASCWLTGTHPNLAAQRDLLDYVSTDPSLPLNVQRTRAGDGKDVMSSINFFSTGIELTIATVFVGMAVPLFFIIAGVLLTYQWCSCGCGRGKDSGGKDATTLAADAADTAVFELKDQGVDGFLAGAGVSGESIERYAGCFRASGLTTAVLRNLVDDAGAQLVYTCLADAGITHIGDRAAIIAHLAESE